MAAFANRPMNAPLCMPVRHSGVDGEGRRSVCRERLGRADPRPVGLLLIALSAVIVLAILVLVLWWATG